MGSFIEPIIELALQTGARIGELLALRWTDVDLERRRISIVRTAQRIMGQGVVFSATKTHRSQRPIALSDTATEALRELKCEQAKQRTRSGDSYDDQDLVLSQPSGRPYDTVHLAHEFRSLADGIGLATATFHSLRHTVATLMLSANIHPKVVSERLGHASVHITLDTYSHVTPGLQEEAAELLDQALPLRA